jgi:cytoskeletal protein CcmA (bactofilin family)
MKRAFLIAFFSLFSLFISSCVNTIPEESTNLIIARGKTLWGSLVITSGQVTMEGNSRVFGPVFINGGNLRVRSFTEIFGPVIIGSGNLDLQRGAVVRGDVFINAGGIDLSSGAVVLGDVIMTSGVTYLNTGAVVRGDLTVKAGSLHLEPGSIVRGDVIYPIYLETVSIPLDEGVRVEGDVSPTDNISSVTSGLLGAFLGKLLGLYCVLPLASLGMFVYLVFKLRRREPADETHGALGADSATQRTRSYSSFAQAAWLKESMQTLALLKEMRLDGLITEKEYELKRAEVIKSVMERGRDYSSDLGGDSPLRQITSTLHRRIMAVLWSKQ